MEKIQIVPIIIQIGRFGSSSNVSEYLPASYQNTANRNFNSFFINEIFIKAFQLHSIILIIIKVQRFALATQLLKFPRTVRVSL